MNSRSKWRVALTATALPLSFIAVSLLSAQAPDDRPFSEYVDEKGNISLPANFERTFVHLGSIAVAPKEGSPVEELHGTYARAQDVEEYRKSGKFPDGAVLVKEVRKKANPLQCGGARLGRHAASR
jgi:hypothetical protein